VLRRFRTVVGVIANEADLDPVECVVTIKAMGSATERPVMKLSLADCFAEVDELLM
jgi:hypothetical protein